MNDFDYDALQKKRIASGAFHMKRGSKSKRCSLPSDFLTPAQLKRRNGPVNTYNINQPMSWETFKSLPVDLQQNYIETLQKRFNVTVAVTSNDLFGKSTPALRNCLGKQGIKCSKMRGRHMTRSEQDLWNGWLYPVVSECAPAEEDPVKVQQFLDANASAETRFEEPEKSAETPVELHRELMLERAGKAISEYPLTLDKLSATFSGDFDAERFLHWVTRLPMPDGKVCINVEVFAL